VVLALVARWSGAAAASTSTTCSNGCRLFHIADVKVGDTIIVSSTQGVDPHRLTAISLVAGADTLLAMLAPRPQPGRHPNPARVSAVAVLRSASAYHKRSIRLSLSP
jgi:hypothetical protein